MSEIEFSTIAQFARGRIAAVAGPAYYGLAMLHRHMPLELRQKPAPIAQRLDTTLE